MQKHYTKAARLLSLFMVLVMVFSLFGTVAFAADESEQAQEKNAAVQNGPEVMDSQNVFVTAPGPITVDAAKDAVITFKLDGSGIEDGAADPMAGAAFALKKAGEPDKYIQFTSTEATFEYKDENGTASSQPDVLLTTNFTGNFVVCKLPAGDYTLEQVSATAGYLPIKKVSFTLSVIPGMEGEAANVMVSLKADDRRTDITFANPEGDNTVLATLTNDVVSGAAA